MAKVHCYRYLYTRIVCNYAATFTLSVRICVIDLCVMDTIMFICCNVVRTSPLDTKTQQGYFSKSTATVHYNCLLVLFEKNMCTVHGPKTCYKLQAHHTYYIHTHVFVFIYSICKYKVLIAFGVNDCII